MSYHLTTDWRNKHNQQLGRLHQNYNTMYHSISSYCTETKTEKMDSKSDLNEILHQSNYLTHLHMLPNPLQKNLADAFHEKSPSNAHPPEKRASIPTLSTESKQLPPESYNTTFASIGSFISGVFSVISSAMPFQRRPKTSDSDLNSERVDSSPPQDFWLPASGEMQNKNNCRDQLNVQLCPNTTHECEDREMSSDCRAAAVNCEDKLNKVRMLLVTKPAAKPQAVVKPRRPKRVFVEPKSVEEGFEDAFTEEDFVRLSNDEVVECVSLCNNVTDSLVEVEVPKMRTNVALLESTEIVKPIDVTVKQIEQDVLSNVSTAEVCSKNVEIPCTDANQQQSDLSTNSNASITAKDKSPDNLSKGHSTHIVSTMSTTSETVPKASSDTLKEPTNPDETKMKESDSTQVIEDNKAEVIQSCEDKVSRLKALLQERRKNNTKINQSSADSVEETVEEHSDSHRFKKNKPIMINRTQNKHYKNPNRLSNVERRTKSNMHRDIKDDMSFANEVDIESSSVENSPKRMPLNRPIVQECITNALQINKSEVPVKIVTESPQTDKECYFNEISGRFRNSSTTESEDSFQIVFTDSPQLSPRVRRPSDCDSEDSFIIFEDVPNSCYTSADVFGHSASETEHSDYDTDDSDHNMPCKLSHNLSRTVSDLTDDSLYEENARQQSRPYSDSEDEIDSSVKMAMPVEVSDVVVKEDTVVKTKGLLLDATKKLARKDQPKKKVQFSSAPPKVRVMRVWAFAARQARAGHWEQHAVDRERFKRKIADIDMAISWVLKPQHRNRVKFQRFMPWWHAERRREIAEKKARAEAEEKRLKEEEARRLEEERVRLEQERIAEEERLKAEKELKEKEMLKAEQKRLKELHRKRLQEEHMKSEAQRAAEVSLRRSENERRRKEEEKFRMEAKKVANELKKKAEEEKMKIEEEIARLEAEKNGVKLNVESRGEQAKDGKNEVVPEVNAVEEGEMGGEKESVGENTVKAEIENEGEGDRHRIEENVNYNVNTLELVVEKEKIGFSDGVNAAKDISSNEEPKDVVHCNIVDSVKDSTNAEIIASDGDAKQGTVSDSNQIIVVDNKNVDNSGVIDSHAVQVCKSTDTDENFVDCLDNMIAADDKVRIVESTVDNNIDQKETSGKVTEEDSETLKKESKDDCLRNNNNLANPKLQNLSVSATESSKKENAKSNNTATDKSTKTTNKNVKSNTNTVEPAMKKIQFTQNCFSPTNVVKGNISKLNAQNVDKNMNTVGNAKIMSPILVNEKSTTTKQN